MLDIELELEEITLDDTELDDTELDDTLDDILDEQLDTMPPEPAG